MKPPYPISGLLLAAIALSAAGPVSGESRSKPRVVELHATLADDRLRASVDFRVEGGVAEDALEQIHSGIPVEFKYRLRMMADRDFPLLPWREVARTKILASVTYDSLTGVYSLTRTIEFRPRRKRDRVPPTEESRETSSVDEMRGWMTEFEGIVLYDPGHPFENRRLRVKLDCDLGRRYVWLIFPGTLGASAQFDLVNE